MYMSGYAGDGSICILHPPWAGAVLFYDSAPGLPNEYRTGGDVQASIGGMSDWVYSVQSTHRQILVVGAEFGVRRSAHTPPFLAR